MKYAIVQVNWNTSFHVPVGELSKFLELFAKYPLVRTAYDGEEYYVHKTKEGRQPSIELTDLEPEACERVKKQEEAAGLTD